MFRELQCFLHPIYFWPPTLITHLWAVQESNHSGHLDASGWRHWTKQCHAFLLDRNWWHPQTIPPGERTVILNSWWLGAPSLRKKVERILFLPWHWVRVYRFYLILWPPVRSQSWASSQWICYEHKCCWKLTLLCLPELVVSTASIKIVQEISETQSKRSDVN